MGVRVEFLGVKSPPPPAGPGPVPLGWVLAVPGGWVSGAFIGGLAGAEGSEAPVPRVTPPAPPAWSYPYPPDQKDPPPFC